MIYGFRLDTSLDLFAKIPKNSVTSHCVIFSNNSFIVDFFVSRLILMFSFKLTGIDDRHVSIFSENH